MGNHRPDVYSYRNGDSDAKLWGVRGFSAAQSSIISYCCYSLLTVTRDRLRRGAPSGPTPVVVGQKSTGLLTSCVYHRALVTCSLIGVEMRGLEKALRKKP